MIRLVHDRKDWQLPWQWLDGNFYLAGFGTEERAMAYGRKWGWDVPNPLSEEQT